MNRTGRLILFSFIESVASVCLVRAGFFFTKDRLNFTDVQNLCLGLAFGVTYVVGAVLSHRTSRRLGEKTIIATALVVQIVLLVCLAVQPVTTMFFITMAVVGFVSGLKWPVLESFISAGKTPAETARSVGHFNIAWAGSIPPTMAVSGLIIWLWPPGLFVVPAVLHAVNLWLIRPLPARPAHLPHDHPDRLDADGIGRYRALAVSSRWLLFCSYASSQALAALMPGVLERLGLKVSIGPAVASVLDVMRFVCFIVLGRTGRWHGRAGLLALSIVALPAGFFAVVLVPHLGIVLVGEAVIGLAAGVIYYAHLYYAMVVKNASVDAGGVHELMIGLGFVLGPLAGLGGIQLASVMASSAAGYVCGIGPMFLICAAGAILPLAAMRRALGDKRD